MTDGRAAKRYARALFNIALQQDILQSVEDDLTGVCAVVAHSSELKRFLYSPNRTREDKLRLLERTFSDRVTALTMHAIRLLLKRRREYLLEDVKAQYLKLRREHDRTVFVLVESARELDQTQREGILDRVAQQTQKKVESRFEVDERLMGGARVTFDNYVLDGTARGYLNRLRDRLLYDLLKQA